MAETTGLDWRALMASFTRRVRRKIANWAAPELQAELRRARTELSRARYDLPPEVEKAIRQARTEHLTYLEPHNLRSLASVVAEADQALRPGLIIEAGTARGGSAIVMAAAKAA